MTPPISRTIREPRLQAWLSQALEVSAIGTMVTMLGVTVGPFQVSGPTRRAGPASTVP